MNRDYKKAYLDYKAKCEELEKLLAQEKEDCASACPNVQLMEKYEQALKEVKKFAETFCGTVCQDYIGDVDCKASCNARFVIEPILDDINEVLNDKE